MYTRVWKETRIILLVGITMPLVAYLNGAGTATSAWMLALSFATVGILVIDVLQRGNNNVDVAKDISISEELSHEMDLLVQQIESSSRDMLGHVRKELSQMRSLVSDAIKILQNSFIDINQEAWAQAAMTQDVLDRLCSVMEAKPQVDAIGDIKDLADKDLKEMSEITKRINSSINDVVRSLQFEDVVRQLTVSSERHIDYLEQVLGAVDSGIRNLNSRRIKVSEYIVGLHELKAQIDRLEAECRAEAARSVSQDSMHEGETELF